MPAKMILVVDDEPDILKFLVWRLRNRGYQVVTAAAGDEALTVAAETVPDLILLDIKLPRLSGDQVFMVLCQNPKLSHIPVIFATADTSIDVAQKAKILGAADYLLKPFDAEQLFEKIEKYLPAN